MFDGSQDTMLYWRLPNKMGGFETISLSASFCFAPVIRLQTSTNFIIIIFGTPGVFTPATKDYDNERLLRTPNHSCFASVMLEMPAGLGA
jgi:hypothetical protein